MLDYSRRTFVSVATRAIAFAPLANLEELGAQAVPALTLAPWKPGQLDIHHISTGRGSCAFLVCPDGTTLMIDAGSILTHLEPARDKYLIDPRPNASLRPGQWIARYVERCLTEANRKEIDYFLLTHFHVDHMPSIDRKAEETIFHDLSHWSAGGVWREWALVGKSRRIQSMSEGKTFPSLCNVVQIHSLPLSISGNSAES